MIRARSNFFDFGAYESISIKACEILARLNPKVIIDAGCGEGYYTESIAKALPDRIVLGFDMSKFGCEHGAKSSKKNNISNICYAVGNIFDLPIKDNCCDAVINMFAPIAFDEFYRVLNSNGHIIVASAGINHLDGLKSVLYNDVYFNEEKFQIHDGFDLISTENLKYDCVIKGNETIKNLFAMTPYYHRTSLEDKQKLEAIDTLSTTIEVNFAIYRKVKKDC